MTVGVVGCAADVHVGGAALAIVGSFDSGRLPRSIRAVQFEARVEVVHRPGIADPQGATVERALPALGWENVSRVRIGKSIRLVLEAADEVAARAQLDEMCRRILTNPVIEDYRIELAGLVDGAVPT